MLRAKLLAMHIHFSTLADIVAAGVVIPSNLD
jgi:hypothetical protein